MSVTRTGLCPIRQDHGYHDSSHLIFHDFLTSRNRASSTSHLHPLEILPAHLVQLLWSKETSNHMSQLPQEDHGIVHHAPKVVNHHVLVPMSVCQLIPAILQRSPQTLSIQQDRVGIIASRVSWWNG